VPNAKDVFREELLSIQSVFKRTWVECIFDDLCPAYFWTIPASSTGKHPEACTRPGGLVLHTKLAVRFATSLSEGWHEDDAESRDEIICAVLLHDMFKRGSVSDEAQSFPDHLTARRGHGRYCADTVNRYLQENPNVRDLISQSSHISILNAVKLHMGKWTHEITHQESIYLSCSKVAQFTHLADYVASRHLDKWLYDLGIESFKLCQ